MKTIKFPSFRDHPNRTLVIGNCMHGSTPIQDQFKGSSGVAFSTSPHAATAFFLFRKRLLCYFVCPFYCAVVETGDVRRHQAYCTTTHAIHMSLTRHKAMLRRFVSLNFNPHESPSLMKYDSLFPFSLCLSFPIYSFCLPSSLMLAISEK